MLSLILGTKFLNLPGSESLRSLQVPRDLNHSSRHFAAIWGFASFDLHPNLTGLFLQSLILPFMSSYARRSLKIYFRSRLNWARTPASLSTFGKVAFMNIFGRTPSQGLSAWSFPRIAARAVAWNPGPSRNSQLCLSPLRPQFLVRSVPMRFHARFRPFATLQLKVEMRAVNGLPGAWTAQTQLNCSSGHM